MPLTESEELELLELERERSTNGSFTSTGNNVAVNDKSDDNGIPLKPGNWGMGVPGTYSAPSIDVGPSYSERVKNKIGDIAGESVRRQELGAGKNTSEIAGKMKSMASFLTEAPGAYELGQIVGGGMKKYLPGTTQAIGTATKAYEEKVPPELKNVIDIGTSAAEIAPIAGVGGKLGAKAVEKGLDVTGKALQKGGKSLLRSSMKPKDVTALLAGKNVEEGAQNIVDNIAKYGIESPTGGFKGISNNAAKKIQESMNLSDEAIKKALKDTPDAVVDIDNTFIKFIDDLENGRINSVFGDEVKSAELANNIHSALELRGLTGIQSIEKIPEIKKVISQYGGGLFKKGPYAIGTDPIKKQVGELAYLKLKEDLEDFVPDIKNINKQTHDLINVKKAADEAAKRIGSRDKIGKTDWILLFGGPTAAHSMGLPSAAAGAIPGSALIAKKALSGGRGASTLISTGRGLEKLGKIGKKKVNIPKTNILNNKKGAIGGVSDEIIGTPAIIDPETGKIYTGGWRGHKDAIIKGETSEIKDRLARQHFLDNTNKYPETVGFIDKKGNFITRKEAEAKLFRPQSMAQMFHTLAGTAGLSGAGLAGGLYLKNKSNK
jgi:hypothetical protein